METEGEKKCRSRQKRKKFKFIFIVGKRRGGSRRGYWKSFIDSLQRTVVFTDRSDTLDRIKAADNVLQNNAEISLSLKSIGVSLVDDKLRREVAYIGVTQ